MRAVIACGGTGGHLFPGLAVGEELIRRKHEVMLVLSEKKIDELAVGGRTEFTIRKVASIGLPPLYSPAIVVCAFRFAGGVRQCLSYYGAFPPDVVLGMGGFTSAAPILAGRLRGARTCVHESNVIPGKANRLNARLARAVLLGFEECRARFPGRDCRVTGTPVRTALTAPVDKAAALEAFGFLAGRRTLLVMGGSQGASAINHAFCRIAGRLPADQLQILHLTGPNEADRVRAAYSEAGLRAFVAGFYHRMEQAYAVADLVVSRSGASSLSEIAFFGLPSVLIPYPYAAEDHQTRNAEVFARGGGAVVLVESDALGERLLERISSLLQEEGGLEKMARQVQKSSSRDAARQIADHLEGGQTP